MCNGVLRISPFTYGGAACPFCEIRSDLTAEAVGCQPVTAEANAHKGKINLERQNILERDGITVLVFLPYEFFSTGCQSTAIN